MRTGSKLIITMAWSVCTRQNFGRQENRSCTRGPRAYPPPPTNWPAGLGGPFHPGHLYEDYQRRGGVGVPKSTGVGPLHGVDPGGWEGGGRHEASIRNLRHWRKRW